MIAALDVHYRGSSATAAAVLFPRWEADDVVMEVVREVGAAAGYVSGSFYLRELPPLLTLLAAIGLPYDSIVIDGYVSLGGGRPGLGMHLWESLDRRVPVVGVAKSYFHETPEENRVFRGGSGRPLYVTAAGVSLDEAKSFISRMAGVHRIPDLLKRVDRLARSEVPT